MAEAIASTILEQLASFTIGKASEAWSLVSGAEKEVERLESNFRAIQYELEHAEQGQYLDKSLKHWLDRFKQVVYDMEDVLDDWKAAVLELQTADHEVETSSTSVSTWKVCFASCISFGSQVVRRHDIATRIKEINEELEQIVKDKDKFKLRERERIKQPKRPESTCFVDVPKLHGRDGIKEEAIRTLLCGSSEEDERSRIPPIITIVGMGGIGKTALAQLIYNDHRIQTHFDKKIWVCLSNSSDEIQIARAILEELDSIIPLQNANSLQSICSQIAEKMEKKKFLLVLDDVWIDRYDVWEKLKPAFQSGMFGSRILVTTRKESVANHIESSRAIPLDPLPDDICWSILSQKAFIGRNQFDPENFGDIGRKIAEKCKGLPLAAKTLGDLLQDKLQREDWQDVLDSELWKSDAAKEYIYAPLLLNYYDLPSAVRPCLLYCAIFPRGYNINPDELVQHWMAQGYLGAEVSLSTKLKGEDYFSCLVAHSYFQDFLKDREGNINLCKMHDIVHGFVRFLTENGFVTEEVVEELPLNLCSKKPRHLRLVIKNCSSSPMSIFGTEKLRSLVAVSREFNEKSSEALQNLYSQSKHLRLLEINRWYLGAEEIVLDKGNLIHLRYLSFVGCSGIESLPEAVCELSNLQFLIINGCRRLKNLPVAIGKLINLKYLYILGCRDLTHFPKGISNLTSLMRLHGNIKMKADGNVADEFSIGDLENLDLLCGNIWVELTGNTIDRDEAKRAKLHKKKNIQEMQISLCSPLLKKDEVVQALNSPSNLHVVSYDRWLRRPAREKEVAARIIDLMHREGETDFVKVLANLGN